jgi:hypothetical protein
MIMKWTVRLIEAAAVTITLAAVCQELEKPREERRWHGKLGIIPYDFRLPTVERLRESFWNPDSNDIFTPGFWGIGWSVNLLAILERMRIVSEYYATEEDFLMPTQTLRKILEHRAVVQ